MIAELLHEGKVDALEVLHADFGPVAFVGDGINDAPALARARVGLAIGTRVHVAIESASVVLVSGDVGGVVDAFDVSRRTLRNFRQNLFSACGYNVALSPVAAGVLYTLMLQPVLAAVAMAHAAGGGRTTGPRRLRNVSSCAMRSTRC